MPLLGPPLVIGSAPIAPVDLLVDEPTFFIGSDTSDWSCLTWQSPNGSEWNLTDLTSDVFTPGGIVGLGGAPVTIVADALPTGGTIVRTVLPQPKTITLPLFVGDDDLLTFVGRWRSLVESFTCTTILGPGQLVMTRGDGTSRMMTCWYAAGLEGDADNGQPRATVALQLYCPDPYWYAVSSTDVYFAYQAPRNFLAPFLTVSSLQTLGQTTVHIDGSQPSFPLWQFTGPFTSVTCSNGTGAFTITRTCVAGETWTVNTTPGQTAAFSSDGTNLFPYLNFPAASLWQLNPGDNVLSLALAGDGPGSSALLSYLPRSETS